MSLLELQADQQPLEVQNLIARMKEIAEKLVTQTPGLPEALAHIHKNLMMHEELVELMDDDEIALLHAAHEKHKQFKLVQNEVKATKKTTKKLTNDDLNNL